MNQLQSRSIRFTKNNFLQVGERIIHQPEYMDVPDEPLYQRDINNDGVLETYWKGCVEFWTHGESPFWQIETCCGC